MAVVLPFMLAGAVLAAGGFGIGKGARAVDRITRARLQREQAQARYEVQKQRLKNAREACQDALERLGRRKLQVIDTEIRRRCNSVAPLNNVQLTDVPAMAARPQAELQAMPVPFTDWEPIDAITAPSATGVAGNTAELVRYGAVGTLATPAPPDVSTGPSEAAAINPTLVWLGGDAPPAGGLGMAGGVWILGSIVTAPILAIGGMADSSKPRNPLARSNTQVTEVAQAMEQMQTVEAAAIRIKNLAEEISNALQELQEELDQRMLRLESIINRESDWRRLSPGEQEAVAATMSLAHLIRQLMAAPLFDLEGYPVDRTAQLLKLARRHLEAGHVS